MRIECADEDVEVAVIVGDLELGAEARRLALGRKELEELTRHGGARPHGVVVASIDHRGTLGAYGGGHSPRGRGRSGRGLLRQETRCSDDRAKDGGPDGVHAGVVE